MVYQNYDSTAYWKGRASNDGQHAVLWRNEKYNQLYREDQSAILNRLLRTQHSDTKILDIGCGIGVVSKMIVDQFPNAVVDAVDFEEMVEVARQLNPHRRVSYWLATRNTILQEKKHMIL